MNHLFEIPDPSQAEAKTITYHGLLRELIVRGLIFPDQWAVVPRDVRVELGTCSDDKTVLRRLAELELLTDYQAKRIGAGGLSELILGNYRILALLGAGGMGRVFKAEHQWLRQPVAIKVVTVDRGADSIALQRFFSEMRTVAQLHHDNIAAAVDAGENTSADLHTGRVYYFVMEYVPGHDLDEMVRKHGPFEPSLACDIAFQVASALEAAHAHQLVHRDIKPPNIRITPDGVAKLLDFGIAKSTKNRLTAPGTVLGSVAFLAPEQAEDSSTVDIRADIHALGGTLYWCLTGQVPFPAKGNLFVEMARRVHEPPPRLRVVRPDLPEALDNVLATMMASKPGDRYATPKEVMRALFPFLRPGSHMLDGQLAPFRAEAYALVAKAAGAAPTDQRVLVVDDEAANRTLFSMVLASVGLAVEEAADGVPALEALARRPFDLVLLDIDMPKMKGTEVLRRLRAAPPSPHLKVIMISGRAAPDDLARLLSAGADDYLPKPFTPTQLQSRVRAALRLKAAQDRSDSLHRNLLQTNHELELGLQARDSDLIQARNAMVLALAELVAFRDNETGDHLLRLQHYCRVLAEAAVATPGFAGQIDGNFISMLECCVPLHDIGKASLPDHILLKPGKLTPEEFAVMKTHVTVGAEILERVARKHSFARAFLQMATDITRSHHERFDGSGYPSGLARDQIPLSARMVSIADVYDALRSRRVYKPALPHAQVVRIMVDESPGQFDPALLAVFQQCAEKFEELFRELER